MDLSSVRIREHFGLITNDTNTSKFSFHVSPPKNRNSVSKEDYVVVDHPIFGEACQVLAQITEITSYQEVTGSSIGDRMGRMLATTEIIGYVDLKSQNRALQKLLAPPNPGNRVYIPVAEFLEEILNRNANGEAFKIPIQIGIFEAAISEQSEKRRARCYVDAQELITKHTIIAGAAGAGKTQMAKILIQELFEKTSIPLLILDSYGEYSSDPIPNSTTILTKSNSEETDITNKIKEKQIVILEGQSLSMEGRREFFTSNLENLLRLRKKERVKPLFLLIEEAESFKGEILDQVIIEGRKIGIAACLITTHPTELGGRILSQMGNQIIGKTNDKDDSEYFDSAGITNIPPSDLTLGEWIVNGINRALPIKMQTSRFERRLDDRKLAEGETEKIDEEKMISILQEQVKRLETEIQRSKTQATQDQLIAIKANGASNLQNVLQQETTPTQPEKKPLYPSQRIEQVTSVNNKFNELIEEMKQGNKNLDYAIFNPFLTEVKGIIKKASNSKNKETINVGSTHLEFPDLMAANVLMDSLKNTLSDTKFTTRLNRLREAGFYDDIQS